MTLQILNDPIGAGVGYQAPKACITVQYDHVQSMLASTPLVCQFLKTSNSFIFQIYIDLHLK